MFGRDNGNGDVPPASTPGPSQGEMTALMLRVFQIDYTDLAGAKLQSTVEGHNVKFTTTGILVVHRIAVIGGQALEQAVEAFTDWNHYADVTPTPEESKIIH